MKLLLIFAQEELQCVPKEPKVLVVEGDLYLYTSNALYRKHGPTGAPVGARLPG